MGNPQTVRIESKGGFTTINEADFDKKNHKIYKEKAAPKKEEKKEEKK